MYGNKKSEDEQPRSCCCTYPGAYLTPQNLIGYPPSGVGGRLSLVSLVCRSRCFPFDAKT